MGDGQRTTFVELVEKSRNGTDQGEHQYHTCVQMRSFDQHPLVGENGQHDHGGDDGGNVAVEAKRLLSPGQSFQGTVTVVSTLAVPDISGAETIVPRTIAAEMRSGQTSYSFA